MRAFLLSLIVSCKDEEPTRPEPEPEADADTDSDADTDVPADSGADSAEDTGAACPDGLYEGPLTVSSVVAYCSGAFTVRYAAETQGVAGGGFVFAQETASDFDVQWSDNHSLVPFETDPCRFYTRLDRELSDGTTLPDPINDWQPNVSTVFPCDMVDAPNYMTFAFAVEDLGGILASCLAFGHDVQGMIEGDYENVGPEPVFDLSICVEGVEAN